MAIKDLSGQRYGRLFVLRYYDSNRHGKRRWLCLCDCGTEKITLGATMVRGESMSCGCLVHDSASWDSSRHGMSGTRVYRIWGAMKTRCGNPNTPHYSQYGGVGISVCDAWQNSFESFYKDMGEPPTNRHSIDRIDGNKGYEPGNCRWATAKKQSENSSQPKVVTHDGKSMNLTEWAEHLDISASSLAWRIKHWGLPQAISATRMRSKSIPRPHN